MFLQLQQVVYIIVLAPLLGSIISGLLAKPLGHHGAHRVTIVGVGIAFIASMYLADQFLRLHHAPLSFDWYEWAVSSDWKFTVGFLIDNLTVSMMVIVTFVSLLVHIYSIGYMHGENGYQRFFSYISLFTFAMLMLIGANNMLQLFFGWEGVGLASYLLIGFYFKRESALQGSLKAFLVNRVGDFGFLLGMAGLLYYIGDLNYAVIFKHASQLQETMISIWPHQDWHVISVIGILLFVGAMGKSAQMPLHVWLPESMEGPTPISALIHAATMVTAGIYMVSRLSPLYELSSAALDVILAIGATGALFMGLLGLVQHDIKRVVAYSTLSQLGYMVAALGASAYTASMFHLLTHACFKALLFLAAGSVIIAMHHEQDMRKMGGLWKKLPITYVTFLIGTLALCGVPPFAGFFSKDIIIEAIALSHGPVSDYAYYCVLAGVWVTTLYSFRALWLTFHGQTRMDDASYGHVKESPWVVCLPLILLAIPSVLMGWYGIEPMLFTEPTLLTDAIKVLPEHNVIGHLAQHYDGQAAMMEHAFHQWPIYLVLTAVLISWILYLSCPKIPSMLASRFSFIYKILCAHYGFDALYDLIFVRGSRGLAHGFAQYGDKFLIDNGLVNGTGRLVTLTANRARKIQTGILNHYNLVMILSLIIFLFWMVNN